MAATFPRHRRGHPIDDRVTGLCRLLTTRHWPTLSDGTDRGETPVRRAIAVLLAAALAACAITDVPVTIRTRTRPNEVCNQARVGGVLIPDPTYGLAFKNPGYVQGVIWPFGYSARRESGVIVLIGPSGQVIAREGDRVLAAGGGSSGDAVNVDCEISVVPKMPGD